MQNASYEVGKGWKVYYKICILIQIPEKFSELQGSHNQDVI